MKLTGQTKDNVVLIIDQPSTLIKWDLSKCVIVENLGVDILIGEPGKVDSHIETKPLQEILPTKDVNGKIVDVPYFKKMRERDLFAELSKMKTFSQENP